MVVVLHRRRDEGIILRILVLLRVVAVLLELPVNEQPLHPPVADAAGVAGEVHPLWKLVHAAQAAAQEVETPLGKLRGLVDENPVIFQAVVLILRGVAAPVSELDGAPVVKGHQVGGGVVGGQRRRHHLHNGPDVVLFQFRVGPTHDEDLDARVGDGPTHSLDAHGMGLAAALGTAVGGVGGSGEIEQLLLLVCFSRVPDHVPLLDLAHPSPRRLSSPPNAKTGPTCRKFQQVDPVRSFSPAIPREVSIRL